MCRSLRSSSCRPRIAPRFRRTSRTPTRSRMVQAGMLYEMLADARLRLYHNITCFRIVGHRRRSRCARCGRRPSASSSATSCSAPRSTSPSYSEPLQLVHREVPADVGFHDLRGLDAAAQRAALDAHIARGAPRPLDIRTAPAAAVARAPGGGGRLVAVLGGVPRHPRWLEPQLPAGRAARVLPRAPRRPRRRQEAAPPTTRFADFIALERQALRRARTRAFWASRVQAPREAHPPGHLGGARRRRVRFVRSCGVPLEDLEPGLRRLARAAGVSRKSVLLAAHLKVMGVISGQRRFFTGLVATAGWSAWGGIRSAACSSTPCRSP